MKKKKNLLFGQGLALHELRNLLVEASMRVRRDRFHSFRYSSKKKKKHRFTDQRSLRIKTLEIPPLKKKKKQTLDFPRPSPPPPPPSSFFFFFQKFLEREIDALEREIEEHCFFCVFRSASFGSLSFWKFFGFWSLGDFKFFFLIVEI